MKLTQAKEFILAKKDILITILMVIVIIGVWNVIIPDLRSRQYKLEIKDLKAKNDILKHQNDSILYQVENIKIDIERSDEIIHSLFEESKMFEEKAKNLSIELKTIKKQYDQASNHANSFTSGEIVEYFSNIK